MARTAVVHLALIPLLLVGASDARAEDLFEITEFASEGRSVAAEFADLNGDGRIDLFVVALTGIPPEERRTIRVYRQRPDGSFGASPHHNVSMPQWSAVYDVADLVTLHLVTPELHWSERLRFLIRSLGVDELTPAVKDLWYRVARAAEAKQRRRSEGRHRGFRGLRARLGLRKLY